MRVLVVDDESGKRGQVVDFLGGLDIISSITEAMSLQGALIALKCNRFDCVVLDMRITTYDVSSTDDGWRPRNSGGVEVLRKMARRKDSTKVIILTQYSIFRHNQNVMGLPYLVEQLQAKYENVHGLVQFQHRNDIWRSSLHQYLREISESLNR